MFKKLFQLISTNQDDSVKNLYNKGVNELARNNVDDAISLFKSISHQHPSAAYNLGLIYLDGAGKILPKYSLARKYFRIADELGHTRAKLSAEIIGLNGERKLTKQQQIDFFPFAVMQYVQGMQFGNLAYLIAYDIKRNILETSTDEIYSLERFLSYELYCIENYANEEVKALYKTSSLMNFSISYYDDWKKGETAMISDYLNDKVFRTVLGLADGKISFFEMGPLRLAIVNTVYELFIESR